MIPGPNYLRLWNMEPLKEVDAFLSLKQEKQLTICNNIVYMPMDVFKKAQTASSDGGLSTYVPHESDQRAEQREKNKEELAELTGKGKDEDKKKVEYIMVVATEEGTMFYFRL